MAGKKCPSPVNAPVAEARSWTRSAGLKPSAASPAAKVTAVSVAPFPVAPDVAPDWSWVFLAAGLLLVTLGALRTTTRG